MSSFRPLLVALVLGSAMISRPAVGQNPSVSLTHMVSVTVPPRVKVQLGASVPVVQNAGDVTNRRATANGLALTVRATQAWSLSIGSAGKSNVQWSLDRRAGFAGVSMQTATVASGILSQIPSAATLFFRDSAAASSHSPDRADNESETIALTVTAQ